MFEYKLPFYTLYYNYVLMKVFSPYKCLYSFPDYFTLELKSTEDITETLTGIFSTEVAPNLTAFLSQVDFIPTFVV